ncbi:MAG: putative motility protein [Deltaproteobacteria bacterium]|nr:putative motility protein [Deltaproteobacteria bacterium]
MKKMMDLVKGASKFQQAKVSNDVNNAVVRKSKEVMKTKGDQILQLIESSAVDPDIGQNVNVVV